MVVQGRGVDAAQLEWLRRWIEDNCGWSRKRLARELCARWNWRDERGRLKDFAARSFLLKLEAGGWIELPALQIHKRRGPKPVADLPGWEEPPGRQRSLGELRPVGLEVIEAGTAQAKRWAYLINRYHYLGLHLVGENLGYLAYDRKGDEVAGLLFGAPAWRCAVRDAYLGWNGPERSQALRWLANNTRFLIFPWMGVPHLASHILGQVAARIAADWKEKYGHGLKWLETFVDSSRYQGTCYRAANWQYVGQTTGRSRQDRAHRLKVSSKAVYLYRLR
ncbi:MAG TPA: Druantia anti-phage system protein DruA [Anaerolineales bacterium]